jgi:hypothetical protein
MLKINVLMPATSFCFNDTVLIRNGFLFLGGAAMVMFLVLRRLMLALALMFLLGGPEDSILRRILILRIITPCLTMQVLYQI